MYTHGIDICYSCAMHVFVGCVTFAQHFNMSRLFLGGCGIYIHVNKPLLCLAVCNLTLMVKYGC